jgi:hypothetical protein
MIRNIIQSNKCLSLFAALITIVLCCYAPDIQTDSPGYIEASAIRGLLYPSFLQFMAFFFGKWYVPVVVLQNIAGVLASLYVISKLTDWYDINRLIQCVIFIVLIYPYMGTTRIGVTILSEPMCYPLFMMFFVHLFEGVYYEHKKSFYYSILWAVLMMLTRKQFGFLFAGFYFVLVLEFFACKRFDIVKWVAPVLMFFAGLMAEYSYVYHKTGKFTATPFSISYVAAPLFIAKYENIEQLHDREQKEFLKLALNERDKMKVGLADLFRENYDFTFPIHVRYEMVHDFFRYSATPIALSKMNMPSKKQDDFVKKISFDLIKLNLSTYMWLYRSTVISALGGYYLVFILSALCIVGALCYIQFRNSMSLFLSMVTFLQFLNYSTVALMQPILKRYVFYTDNFYLISVILLASIIYGFMKKQDVFK